MTRNQEYPPKPEPIHTIGVGEYEGHFFVGVFPPINKATLDAAGEIGLKGWAIEDIDGSITGATTLRKRTRMTEGLARRAAISLTIGIARETGKSTVFLPQLIEMGFGTAPFEGFQTATQ